MRWFARDIADDDLYGTHSFKDSLFLTLQMLTTGQYTDGIPDKDGYRLTYFLMILVGPFLIFAILIEELGIFGGLILISLYVTLFIGLLSIAFDSFKKNRLFQGYTIFGIFLLVVIQVFFNIAVNIGLLPTKGLTLPFISYGGTSIIIMLSLMGIVLRINNENKLL